MKSFRRLAIDDYESFKDLPTFLLEISSPLEFKLDKTNHYIADFFINKYGGIEKIHRQPLFIIDGKMTRTADFVARIPIEKIKYIDLLNDLKKLRRQFGPIGQYGLAVVTTKSGNQKLPASEENDIFNIPGFQCEIPFPIFDPNQLSNEEQQPILKPQLYWNPTLETDENGKTNFSFFQSDDLSTFRIEVVVQSDTGDFGYGTWTYQVLY